MDALEIGKAIDEIFDLLRRSNKYIDETMPWSLAKDDGKRARLETVLYHLLEAIRVSAIYISPFLPDTSKEIFRQLNQRDCSISFQNNLTYQILEPKILFQRIDVKRG